MMSLSFFNIRGLDVSHWKFPENANYVDQTETCTISAKDENDGITFISCSNALTYSHSSGFHVGHITRSITLMTAPNANDRGHLLHTGEGRFEIRNTRIENFGRTTTAPIDSTEMQPSDLKFGEGIAQMIVSKYGSNQIGEFYYVKYHAYEVPLSSRHFYVARYAIHAHHSLVEAYFTGNAALYSPRDGMVAHNSRVHILENIIVGADGAGIFLEGIFYSLYL